MINTPKVKPISDVRRELMLRVANDYHGVFPILMLLHDHVRCDDILRWLLKNRKTGRALCEYIQERYDGSLMLLMQDTVAQIDRAKIKALRLGRDFRR